MGTPLFDTCNVKLQIRRIWGSATLTPRLKVIYRNCKFHLSVLAIPNHQEPLFDIPLFFCSSVPLFFCYSVLLLLCSSVTLFVSSSVPLFVSSSVLLFVSSSVPRVLDHLLPLYFGHLSKLQIPLNIVIFLNVVHLSGKFFYSFSSILTNALYAFARTVSGSPKSTPSIR